MKLVLNGTSSGGKTTIMNNFPNDYVKISIDDYFKKMDCSGEVEPVAKFFENKYYTTKQVNDLYNKKIAEYCKKKINKKSNFIIEHYDLTPFALPNSLGKDVKEVLVYTNLHDLTRNISKRKNYDPRGITPFFHFAQFYIRTDNMKESIDTINYDSFIKNLLNIKYEFSNKDDLIAFAGDICIKMDIKTSGDHFIMPRYRPDYLLATAGKTPKQLVDELLNHKF